VGSKHYAAVNTSKLHHECTLFCRVILVNTGTKPGLSLDMQVYIATHDLIYEGESVNRSHVVIKRKTYDIRTWEKHLFLDILHQH
jgi:hypothetical protein